ncbi:MAG: hypothetical protein ACTSPQ_18585, partial [Candidatus Helarchaeota archaeon]
FKTLKRLLKKYEIPIIMTGYNDRCMDEGVELTRSFGIPVLYPSEAAKTLAKMWEYQKWIQNHKNENTDENIQ